MRERLLREATPRLGARRAVRAHLVADVPVGATPTAIAQGDDAYWVTNADDHRGQNAGRCIEFHDLTLAGNATILGAAANVIVAEKAEAKGVEINFWKFTLVGFPIAMATLLVSTIMLLYMF